MKNVWRKLVCVMATLALSHAATGAIPDLGNAYTVGSWQEREEITYDRKDKEKSRSNVHIGVVGEESVDGEPHVWIEARTQQYKKNGKKKGDEAILKMLVAKNMLTDFANPVQNLQKFAKRILMKGGDGKVLDMTAGGPMASMVMKAFGVVVDLEFAETGERRQVSIGDFDVNAYVIKGSGTAEFRVIRKNKVEMTMDTLIHPDFPFAVIEQTSVSVTNGKSKSKTITKSKVTDAGKQGAVSLISDEDVKNAKGLFGGMNLPFGK